MSRRLGQHFLKDKNAIRKIVAALDLKDGETVIEVGAGHGELTQELKNKSEKIKIIAIEKDPRLVSWIMEHVSQENLEVIEGNILKVLPQVIRDSRFKIHDYKLVGNIPYYLTGKLLRLISELENKPRLAVFTIQKEVAERICARPPKMNRLAASVQFWAKPEIVTHILKESFSPPPKVESTVVKLVSGIEYQVSSERYYEMVRGLFKQPRKTILNNLLAKGLEKSLILQALNEVGTDPGDRPQDLSVQKIGRLARKAAGDGI